MHLLSGLCPHQLHVLRSAQRSGNHTRPCRSRCLAVHAAPHANEALRKKPRIRVEDLNDPAHIGGSSIATRDVQDFGSDLSIETYMQLPVEQYYELDPAMIRPLGSNRFALQVPRVHLFNVWVEPLVEVQVQQAADKQSVVIEALNCSLTGSPMIQNLELDKRFFLSFSTTLTWNSPARGTPSSNGSTAPQPPVQGQMTGNTKLDVWSEVVPPFQLMPRFMLEGTSNAVMGALVSNLLPRFMERLTNDYIRWANDASYRASRQAQA